jgi:Tol biopolymer transport system component
MFVNMAARTVRFVPALVVLVLLSFAVVAYASFPGRNGPTVVSLAGCSESSSLWAMPWRGGEPLRALTRCSGDGNGVEEPHAVPGGRSLLAVREGRKGFQIVRVNADGSGTRRIPLSKRVYKGASPSVAPNGERFVFVRDGVLWKAKLDGSGLRRLTNNEDCSRRGCYGLEDPRWSPDGRLIAVSAYTGGSRPALTPGLWLLNARSGEPVRPLRHPSAEASQYDWAPDGRSLVVATAYGYREGENGPSGLEGGDLYTVPRTGGEWQLLRKQGDRAATSPVWSPDGRWIEWVALKVGGTYTSPDVSASIWRIAAVGGQRRLVRRLPKPDVIDTSFHSPRLTWLTRP